MKPARSFPPGRCPVVVVRLEPKATKNGSGHYLEIALAGVGNAHRGMTHVERLNLNHEDPSVVQMAHHRLHAYAAAVGIDLSGGIANIASLVGRPLVVTMEPRRDNPAQTQVVRVERPDQLVAIACDEDEAHTREMEDRPKPRAPDELVIRRVSDVAAVPLRWLWPQRLALGKLSILAGDPGLGKSQLTAFLAATVTNGGEWPNSEGRAEQGDVIMLSCEDDLADTIRPRLEAAQANLDLVHVVEAIAMGTGRRRSFTLEDDLNRLENALQQLGGRARLVIVDPITAYLGKTDSHRTSDVRAALAPLQDLAGRYGVSVVAVSHTPKSGGNGKAVNAVTGSQAFVAAARSTWIVMKDKDDPDRRLMLEAKNNLGRAKGLAFRISTRAVQVGWETAFAPFVLFDSGEVEISADEALKIDEDAGHKGLGRNKKDIAKAFLHAELTNGPVEVVALTQRAEAHGITYRTLKRAADDLGIITRKDSMTGGWVWGYVRDPQELSLLTPSSS